MPRDFIDRLMSSPRPLIMEIKRRDAVGVDLVRGRSVAELVATYEALGAPCISVVTGRWFGGDDALLEQVRNLTALPLLKKDFITNERQIDLARDQGAAAVLLTAKILPSPTLDRLIKLALDRGLTPFVEIASAKELRPSAQDPRVIVAVNNKDIAERERGPARLNRSRALLSLLRRSGVACPVSASGIETPRAAADLLAMGFAGLLIGTGILRADDPGAWLTALDRERHHPFEVA